MQTLGLKHVATIPGRLESESIVVAYGQDLFAARISPSRSFDVLSPTFNKAQLVITISGLAFALFTTRAMASPLAAVTLWYLTMDVRRSKGGSCGKSGTRNSGFRSLQCPNRDESYGRPNDAERACIICERANNKAVVLVVPGRCDGDDRPLVKRAPSSPAVIDSRGEYAMSVRRAKVRRKTCRVGADGRRRADKWEA